MATEKNNFNVALTCNRNGKPTVANDSVHAGFDVAYTIDDLDRVADAEEGTYSGGSISSRTRHQIWTLDHTGNWDVEKLDLDGDDNWNETNEHNDDRTHNAVNELTARDTDDNGSDNYTLTYNAQDRLARVVVSGSELREKELDR